MPIDAMPIDKLEGSRLPGVSAMQAEDSEFGRFSVLLCTLLIFMCSLPFLSETGIGFIALRIGTSLLLISAIYSVSERRWHLILAIVLALPAVAAHLVPTLLGESVALKLRMGMSALFFVYIAVLISTYLLKQDRVSADMIFGAINVYLLLAIGFMFTRVQEIVDQALFYQGESLSIVLRGSRVTRRFLFYFSVVTLTTLGYGDITPRSPQRECCGQRR
jgi:hypothetical protein